MARQTVKQMLIDLYQEEREQGRCALVHELKREAKEVTKPYMIHTDELESDISELNSQISGIREKIRKHIGERDEKIRKHIGERDERLKEKKLFVFSHQTCGDALHENLIKFDKETNDHIRSILEGEK